MVAVLEFELKIQDDPDHPEETILLDTEDVRRIAHNLAVLADWIEGMGS